MASLITPPDSPTTLKAELLRGWNRDGVPFDTSGLYADFPANSEHYQYSPLAMAEGVVQPPASQNFPLSLQEIEGLVKSLYEPGNAKKITETEATLRVLQRSPQGWDIGDALLNSTDENVRFFGALTFTIKLNADS